MSKSKEKKIKEKKIKEKKAVTPEARRNFFRRVGLMLLGCVLMAVGIYFFKIPNGFSTGGISGIGTILGKITPISTATWISGLNVILLIVCLAVLGKEAFLKTVFCSITYSAFMQVFEVVIPIKEPLTDQPFLELVVGILLSAIGTAIIFNVDGSTGGTDVIALIIKKYSSLDVGKALLVTDFLIAASTYFVFGLAACLYSLLGLFAKAFLIDGVIESFNSCKYFLIITKKPDEIKDYILKTLDHSASYETAHGAYTNDTQTIIHTVCKRFEGVKLRRAVRLIDPDAFMIVTTTSEIIGRGFRSV